MKTRNPIRLTLLVITLLSPPAAARGEWRGGIGVLGDSYSDEYQFYPPHRSTARNWVEILATTRRLNFGRFSTASRDEPRNQGYEYNWARSDATTDDLIATGQHLGVAAQAARGEVGLVVVFIGGNDFINAMKTPDPVAAFREVGPRAEANLERAVATILEAHPAVKVVIITVPDIRELPEFRVPLSTGHLPRATPTPPQPPSGGTTPRSAPSLRASRASPSWTSPSSRGAPSWSTSKRSWSPAVASCGPTRATTRTTSSSAMCATSGPWARASSPQWSSRRSMPGSPRACAVSHGARSSSSPAHRTLTVHR